MEKWTTPEPETFPAVPSFGFLDAVPAPRHPVAVPLLLAGTMITVRTRNTLYRLTVVDGPARQISIRGGRLFGRHTNVQLLGALDGDEGVKAGWIVEGLQLQLMTSAGPVITSIVESVDVDIDPTALTDEETE
ncbi:MAG TPA: hypothetical protein VIR54_15250 [Vicinamibacterales bacterium]|jgi:hypothetical protein